MKTNVRYLVAFAPFCALALGCADNNKQPTTKPLTAEERQQQILADPMHYGPDANLNGKNSLAPEKPTLKNDLDNFFNP